MTVPTERHREIATKIAIRAGRGANEQYVSYVASWLATVRAEERERIARLVERGLLVYAPRNPAAGCDGNRQNQERLMPVIEQCREAIGGKLFIRMGGTVDQKEVVETVLAEFARMSQSEEMVEKIADELYSAACGHDRDVVAQRIRDILAALFRETEVIS
jgi:hypothetical protein